MDCINILTDLFRFHQAKSLGNISIWKHANFKYRSCKITFQHRKNEEWTTTPRQREKASWANQFCGHLYRFSPLTNLWSANQEGLHHRRFYEIRSSILWNVFPGCRLSAKRDARWESAPRPPRLARAGVDGENQGLTASCCSFPAFRQTTRCFPVSFIPQNP